MKINGGEKASRNKPKSYSKQRKKEAQQCRRTSFLRKHLSSETVYTQIGISENLKNLLKIWTSGDISTFVGFKSPKVRIQSFRNYSLLSTPQSTYA
jgi:hypothetical protein